ncbi:uncharacterized protein LOC144927866 isoform X7 [Branchiostoma floridae x Branchiostoma belcheri]
MTDYTCLQNISERTEHLHNNKDSTTATNRDHGSRHNDHTFFTHIYDCMEDRNMPPKKPDCGDHVRLALDLTPVIYSIRRAKNEAYVIQNRLKWMKKSKSTPDLSHLGDEILFLEGFAESSAKLDTRGCSHTYSRSRAHQRRGDCPYCARVRSNSAPNVREKNETLTGQSENLPREKSGSQNDLRSPTRWRSEEDVVDCSKNVITTRYQSHMKIDISGDSRAPNSQEIETKEVAEDKKEEKKIVREELSVHLESGEQNKSKSKDQDINLGKITTKTEEMQYTDQEISTTVTTAKSTGESKDRKPTGTRKSQANKELSDIPKIPTKTEEMQYTDQEISTTTAKSAGESIDRKPTVTRRAQTNKELSDIPKIPTKTEEMQYTDQELSTTTAKSTGESKDRKSTVTRRAQANKELSDIPKIPTKTEEMQYTDQEISTTTAKSTGESKDRKPTVTRRAQTNKELSDIPKIQSKTEELQHTNEPLATTTAKSKEQGKDLGRKSTITERAHTKDGKFVQQKLPDSSEENLKTKPTTEKGKFVPKKVEKPPPKKIDLKGYYSIENLFQNRSKWLSRSQDDLLEKDSPKKSRAQENLLKEGPQKKFSKDGDKKTSKSVSRSQDDLLHKDSPKKSRSQENLLDEGMQKKLSKEGDKKAFQSMSRSQERLQDKGSQIKKFSRSQEDLLDVDSRKTFSKDGDKKASLASPTRTRLSRSEENLISDENSKKRPEVGTLTIDPSKFSATNIEVLREIPNVQANLVKERISLYESFVEEAPSVEIRSKSLPRNVSKTQGNLRSRSLPRNVYEKFEGRKSEETVVKKPTAAARRSRGLSRRADALKKGKVPSGDLKRESKTKKEVYKPKVAEETPKKDVKDSSMSQDVKSIHQSRSRCYGTKEEMSSESRSKTFKEETKETKKSSPPKDVKNSSTLDKDAKPIQQSKSRHFYGTKEESSLESKLKTFKEETKETKNDSKTSSAAKDVSPFQVKQKARSKSSEKTEKPKAVTQSLVDDIEDDYVMLHKVRRSDKIPESSEGLKAVEEKQPQVEEKVEKMKYPRVEGDAFILTKIRTTQLMEDEEDTKTKPTKNWSKGTNGLTTAVAGYALNSTEGKLVNAKPVWIDTGWPEKGELDDGFYTAKYGWIEPQKPRTVQEGIFLAKMVWAASDSDHDSTYTAPGRIGPRPRPTSPTSDAGCQTDPEFAFSDTEVQTDGLDKFAYNRRDPTSVENFKSQIETIVTAMAQPIVSAALAAERQQQSQMPQNGSNPPSSGVASSLGMALRVAEDVVDSAIEKAGKIARPLPTTRTSTNGDGDSGVEGSEWDSMDEQLMEELLTDVKAQCLRKLAGAIVEEMGIQTERDGPFLAPVQEEREEEAETDGSAFRPLSDRLRRKREESVRKVELDNEPALLYEGKKRKGYVDPKKGSMLARADLDSTLASIIGEEAPEQKAEFTTEMKFTAVYKTNDSAVSGKESPTGSIDRDDLLDEDQNWMIPEPRPKRLLSRKISGSIEALNSETPLDKTPYDDHDSVVSEPEEKEGSDDDTIVLEKESRTPTNGSLSPGEIRKSDFEPDQVQKYEKRVAKEQKLRKKRELETKSSHNDSCDHDKTSLQKKVQATSKQQNVNNEEPADDFNLNKLVHIHGQLDSLDTQLKGVSTNSARTGKTKKSPKERKPSEEGYYSAKGESISSPRSEVTEEFTDNLSKSAFDTYSKRVSQIPLSSTASSLSSVSPDMDSSTPIFTDSGPSSPGGSYSVKRKEEIEISNLSEKVSAKQEEVLESAQDILHSANQLHNLRHQVCSLEKSLRRIERIAVSDSEGSGSGSGSGSGFSSEGEEFYTDQEVFFNTEQLSSLTEYLKLLKEKTLLETTRNDLGLQTEQTAARAARQVTSTVLTTLKSAEQVSQGQPDEPKTISVKRKQGSMDEAERLEEEVYLNAGKVFALQEDLRHLQNQVENIQEDTPETQVRALEERVTRTIAQVQQSAEHVRKSQERLEQIGVGPVKIIEDRMRNVNLGSSPTNTAAPARPVPAPRKSLQQKVAEEHNRRKSPGNSRRQSRTNSRTNLAVSPEREEEGFDRNLAYRSSITKRGGESGLKWELAQEAEKEPEETDRPKRLADVRRWRAKNQRADTDSSEPLSRLKSDSLTSPSVRERAAVWDQHWRQESDKQRLKNDSMRVLSQWEVEREKKRQEWSPTRLTSPTSPGWSRESSVSPGRTHDWSRESPSTPGHRFDWSRGNPTSPGSQRDWSRESSTSPGNRPGPTASENRPVYYSRRVLGRRGMVTSL